MELHHIRLFCLVMELRSVTKAARKSFLTQPTVTQHLKSLESELGMTLFERQGRQLVPTEAGEIFYGYAKKILGLLEEAHRALDDHVGVVRGDLRIAGSTIPGHYILPRLLGKFCSLYPEVRPHLHIGDSQGVMEMVSAKEVDLGFVGAVLHRPALIFQPFAQDELIVVQPAQSPFIEPKTRPLPPSALKDLPFLSREPGSGTRTSWERLLLKSGVDPSSLRIVGEFGSTESLIQGVKAGLGVGVVSLRAVKEDLRQGTLLRVPLQGPAMERTFYVVRLKSRALSLTALTFQSFVLDKSGGGTASLNGLLPEGA
jgi:DNA-binding transcriptional LysR family regulator